MGFDLEVEWYDDNNLGDYNFKKYDEAEEEDKEEFEEGDDIE